MKDFEQNTETVKKEYEALKAAYGARDDYQKHDGEHTLNQGEWHWMNYVSKGVRHAALFKQHCPVTT